MTEVVERLALSYLLPIRRDTADERGELSELSDYLGRLSRWVDEVIVVDGSPPDVFRAHDRAWAGLVDHVRPDPSLVDPPDKPAGVVTGSRLARHEVLVVGDDDVRWSRAQLAEALAGMDDGVDLIRPQNRFVPAPWHARWDTGRMLLNRAAGGDWPGTMVVRRRYVAPGYGFGVLFENLDLVRTVQARGGRAVVARHIVVDRRPPETAWFWRQRVRQAYDEMARPWHLAWQLALLPAILVGRARVAIALTATAIAVAEVGRRRGGRALFPATAALWAPAWLAERALCSWLALGARLRGGVRYRGRRMASAATPTRLIRS